MASSKYDLTRRALTLPDKDRADLGTLIESLDAEADAAAEEAWRAEIARRARELKSGVVRSIPWNRVKRRIMRSPSG